MEVSASVMASSWRVQSALSSTTLALAKACWTADWRSATRSLTWQLKHQLAVKSTKTGCPWERLRLTASAVQGCHAAEEVEFAAVEEVASSSAILGAQAETAITASTSNAATAVDQRLAGQRPRNQPAMASNRKLASRAAKTAAP